MNESRTVIYNDNDYNVFRQTAGKTPIKVVSWEQLAKLFSGTNAVDRALLSVQSACVRGDKIILCVSYDFTDGEDDFYTSTLICETGKNGGQLKVIDKSLENKNRKYRFSICKVQMYGDSIFVYKYYTKANEDYKWHSEYVEL